VVVLDRHSCSMFTEHDTTRLLFYALWWSHKCEARSSHGNPNHERVCFVRQQYSLTLENRDLAAEWKDLSEVGRTRPTLALLSLVFYIVIVSSSMLSPWKSRKITKNHEEKLVTIELNICSCGLFPWNLCLPQIIKHSSMLWCFAWVYMKL